MEDGRTTVPEGDQILSARQLAHEYEEDPDIANETYRNEQLTVQGEILEIRNVISAVVLRVLGVGKHYSGVHLELHLRSREDAEYVEEGKSIRFRGECQGYRIKSGPKGQGITWIRFTDAVLE